MKILKEVTLQLVECKIDKNSCDKCEVRKDCPDFLDCVGGYWIIKPEDTK